jgi:hypothetical protein
MAVNYEPGGANTPAWMTAQPPARPHHYGVDTSAVPAGGFTSAPVVSTPVSQVATTPQAGNANFWDMLRNLFSGQQGPRQGMGGMISPTTGQPTPMSSADAMPMGVLGNYSRYLSQPRGQAGPGTNALGNHFGRF